MKKILIIGASSAIAQVIAQRWAERGDRLFLVARDAIKLEILAKDLRIRGANAVSYMELDVNDFGQHQNVFEQALGELEGLDIVLIAHGTLPDQQKSESSASKIAQELNTNALSVLVLLVPFANYFQSKGKGTIAVITSVAGDRGRQSNYVYGSAKACVSTYLQGLRNRLYHYGIKVVDIKPGFVDTPMTQDIKKGPLWVKPEKIAPRIIKAIDYGSDVVYVPRFWRIIMAIIVSIPETLFKRLRL